jgi:ribosomal protein S18 acetylase RimI-like enzyme
VSRRDEKVRPELARVRPTRREDFPAIIALCRRVYPTSPPWTAEQLASHLSVFPEGQLVAVVDDEDGERVVGMAASLIVLWDDYDHDQNWREFTDGGFFRNHDPDYGRTLYGAEVMVDPDCQGRGVGSGIYRAREKLARRLGLRRIRAGARLRGYHRWADRLTPEEYVQQVVAGTLHDPTLTFQLNRGFEVQSVVGDYLRKDPASLGFAALIEWLNPEVAQPDDAIGRDPRFRRPTSDVGA